MNWKGLKIIIATICLLLITMAKASAQNYGLTKSQDPATLPKSLAAIPKAIRKARVEPRTILEKVNNEFIITRGWEMIEAAKVANLLNILNPSFKSSAWYNATVPGTVLTTLVDQGVYPDPYWGINNLSIPDTLCRQNWWYRTLFQIPANQNGKTCWLTFKGINYEAHIWLNGHNLGSIKGAFKRGVFNITNYIKPTGQNVLAVQIIPPPHPGIPHEQSILAGRGPNGGALCIDGPTFISSEGWDWIPGIRDRNIGIWQDVALSFSGEVTINDPQVITDLDLPDTTHANITIKTNLHNITGEKQHVTLTANIENINVAEQVILMPFENKIVKFTVADHPQLRMKNPRLWWPNGYGKPNLYQLKLAVKTNDQQLSDNKNIRFGVRELSYEMTVDASGKKDWRVEYDPTDVFKKTDKPLFNNAYRRKVSGETFVPELAKGADASLLYDVADKSVAPYLVIKVNGKRIFCRGGNWGMDDGMKRVSRERLEPYFRLTREANFNMIRNWTGESTEEVFYDLCDKYGLLVWNDFWTSTENYNVLPLDNKLFLENAKEVVHRFRNHPSIVIWCPRNEGYVPPELELPLASLIATEDGTRHYQPNSRYMNLRTSGPWDYIKDATYYYTHIADGFSTELGTPSVPTATTMRKMMAKEDLWPISDVWHYHDFHFGQKDYVNAIDSLYGTATNLDDFCRKAQMVNYDSHRAMFESWNSKLWNSASGLLIWMSHPAWPSTVWQAYSSDYETFGSYYGAKSACEPVHIQMNLHDHKVVVVNTSLNKISNALAKLCLFDLDGKKLYEKQININIAENKLTNCFIPDLPAKLPKVYLARLLLTNNRGSILSQNDYWKRAEGVKDFKLFNTLKPARLMCNILVQKPGMIYLKVTNVSDVTCIGIKLNLQNSNTNQLILPVYCQAGYFNLLPGETKDISITTNDHAKKINVLASAYNLASNKILQVSFK